MTMSVAAAIGRARQVAQPLSHTVIKHKVAVILMTRFILHAC